ncbi:MAG: hypothetical protein JXR56_09720 [Candidatus Cloacimonetes bacterium]|nr:hypothetical protein [Candidatus Cloacimonadota bacterium]
MKKYFVIGILLLMLVVLNSQVAIQNSKRVLITSSRSDYKKDLVAQIVDELTEMQCEVVVENNKFLKDTNPMEYDAIVILNKIYAGKQEKKVRNFLAGLSEKEKEKVLVVNTVGAKKYVAKQPNVPLITSASENSKAEETAREMMYWLKSKLK